MKTAFKFSLGEILEGTAFPHEHVFEDGPFEGFAFTYRALPSNVTSVLAEAIGDKVKKFGLDAYAFVGRMTGCINTVQAKTLEEAFEKLDTLQILEVEQILRHAAGTYLRGVIGEWNAVTATGADVPLTAETCAKMPEYLVKEIMRLAGSLTLTPEKQSFLGTSPNS